MGTDKWRGYREKVGQTLSDAGYSEASVGALIDLDGEMFRMMRSMVKGELPAQLMAELGSGLELAQFQALTAITRIQGGIGRSEQQEATIGLVAEEMNVDPSRASRIVADLIAAGHVRRDVSQSDGRKAVLTLTETATAMFAAFRDLKWAKFMQVFADWSEDEILAFSSLFLRYNEGMRRVYPGRN